MTSGDSRLNSARHSSALPTRSRTLGSPHVAHVAARSTQDAGRSRGQESTLESGLHSTLELPRSRRGTRVGRNRLLEGLTPGLARTLFRGD
eukprot:7358213-Prymnesium_polylepis.1